MLHVVAYAPRKLHVSYWKVYATYFRSAEFCSVSRSATTDLKFLKNLKILSYLWHDSEVQEVSFSRIQLWSSQEAV